jgi:1-acyl-sn-glycerol-3-phosphate acyltransferase
MASRKSVTLGFILTFWGLLPGALAALAVWGQARVGPRMRLEGIAPFGAALGTGAGLLLALSIVQYVRASGRLPISAFPPGQLIRSGVFGIWRHPIYLFAVFFYGGWGVAFWPAGFLLVSFPLLVLATVVYARKEEAGLEKRFGASYAAHRRQTSLLVPRLIHVLRWVSAALFGLCFRFRVSGRENARIEPPFFVVAAHRNYLDPVFVLAALGRPVRFITDSGMFRSRLTRFVFGRLLALPKKRHAPAIGDALAIRRLLRESCVIGLFPEAERSWSGSMLSFKPAVLKLLRRYPGIPVLPVRLDGAFEAWPRWAPRPRRARITATILPAVQALPEESPAELGTRLATLIMPRRIREAPPRPIPARGIEALIYRCPDCLSLDAIRSGRDHEFRCVRCLAGFELLSDMTVRRTGLRTTVPLEILCRRIFVGPTSAGRAVPLSEEFVADGTELALEGPRGRIPSGPGRLILGGREVRFDGGDAEVRIALESVRAVLVEGARVLQVYGGQPARLCHFRLAGQSALKWQHLIAEAVRAARGKSPATA